MPERGQGRVAYCASDVTRSLSRAAGFADSLSMAAIIDVRKITNFKRSCVRQTTLLFAVAAPADSTSVKPRERSGREP
eukprot:1310953-Rhodomonas_salina.1